MNRPASLILNVDDTEAARYAKHRTLTHAGFLVEDAGSGAEALHKVEALRPDLVLLDVRLPDISGIEVCKQIKQRWPATAVLQTSATFTSPADRARGLEGGADSYLIQPIDPGELVASVRALLRLHAAEEKLRQLNETLERRIDERTADLANVNARLVEQIAQREHAEAALVQSQKMEAVGQLAATMAHDFNNILASVVGYMYLMRRKVDDTSLRALTDKAISAVDRGRRLTSRVLAFTRSDDLVTTAVDVRALLDGMEDWLRQTVGSAVTLKVDVQDGVDLVATTDAGQLELAILNLVINARDAISGTGSIGVQVNVHRLDAADGELPPGDYVVVNVSDSGSGMPPEVAARAFDPFFTTKPVGQGTGLGLSQVGNVARLSRGAARIRTVQGEGTTVSIWLAWGDASQLETFSRSGFGDLSGQGERILLVDDEADIRRTVSQLLNESGYEVESAASGVEALDLVAASPPDLLLLDVLMPGIGGLEVARRVRQVHPQLPIIFLSAHANVETIAAEVPHASLLRKPFLSEELSLQIRRCLGARLPASDQL